MASRTESKERRAVAKAIALALAAAVSGLPGCRTAESAASGRRPANAALMVLASGSLQGNLRAVG